MKAEKRKLVTTRSADKVMQFNVCMDATISAKNNLRKIDAALRQDLNEGRR